MRGGTLLWPRAWMISGARYSGVPHRVHVRSVTLLANPKSIILRWPSLSSNRFSGFRSLGGWVGMAGVGRDGPVDDGEGVEVLQGTHYLSRVEEGGGRGKSVGEGCG